MWTREEFAAAISSAERVAASLRASLWAGVVGDMFGPLWDFDPAIPGY